MKVARGKSIEALIDLILKRQLLGAEITRQQSADTPNRKLLRQRLAA